MKQRVYMAIDLKSFYASVECVQRGLDPLNTNLVVADKARKNGTICLAVSPGLKKFGLPSRPRLFQLMQEVQEINLKRAKACRLQKLTGKSIYLNDLQRDPSLAIDYIVAKPQMALYIKVSSKIYQTYLKWIAPEDIHVYSIDEVFMDLSKYLNLYKMTPRNLAKNIILDVLKTTGITATAGLGTNLYLAKIAMDIWSKKIEADENGVMVAGLTEESFRKNLWTHRPITDFWRIGRGYARRLAKLGLYTMGDIARCSTYNEDILYKTFGINAELLIDHAWGYEPVTIKDIRSYKPKSQSLSNGQVLPRAYTYNEARIVVKEMADVLAFNLVKKGLVTDQISMTITYDHKSLENPRAKCKGPVKLDINGIPRPKSGRKSKNLGRFTSSSKLIRQASQDLFDEITDRDLLVRKISIVANNVLDESFIEETRVDQLDFFTDYKAREEIKLAKTKEKKVQKAVLDIKESYGKNAIVRGLNLEEPATGIDRNKQIGGHRA